MPKVSKELTKSDLAAAAWEMNAGRMAWQNEERTSGTLHVDSGAGQERHYRLQIDTTKDGAEFHVYQWGGKTLEKSGYWDLLARGTRPTVGAARMAGLIHIWRYVGEFLGWLE